MITVSNEDKVAVLKRTIRRCTRPPNHVTEQLEYDLTVIDMMIEELGGNTHNDYRRLRLTSRGYRPFKKEDDDG